MFKTSIIFAMLLSLVLAGISCSSSESMESNKNLKTFDIYDQDLESLVEKVAEHFDLDLDFDVDSPDTPFSLSVLNASINDVLRRIEAETGFHAKVIDGEIIIQEESFEDDMAYVTLNMNGNLWKDIRSASTKIDIDEETVKNFFGPLFYGVEVEDIDRSSGKLVIYAPKKEIAFIKDSLLFLNYIQQRRNSAITLWVVENNLKDDFLKGKIDSNKSKFAWRLNAGDNLTFKSDKGVEVKIQSQLLSESNNIAETEAFIRLEYGKDSTEGKFNFAKQKIQAADLSDKLSLIAKIDWFTNGRRIDEENLSSNSLTNSKSGNSNDTPTGLGSGNISISNLTAELNNKKITARVVSFTKGGKSDISQFSVNLPESGLSLSGLAKTISMGSSIALVSGNDILIDCQGKLTVKQISEWTVLKKPLDASYFRFNNGAFMVNKENLAGRIQYLPSANALVGFTNSGILK